MTNPPTPEPVDRFADARAKIESHIDMICAISSVFAAFKDHPEEALPLEPYALSQLNQEVYSRACRVSSILQDIDFGINEDPV